MIMIMTIICMYIYIYIYVITIIIMIICFRRQPGSKPPCAEAPESCYELTNTQWAPLVCGITVS